MNKLLDYYAHHLLAHALTLSAAVIEDSDSLVLSYEMRQICADLIHMAHIMEETQLQNYFTDIVWIGHRPNLRDAKLQVIRGEYDRAVRDAFKVWFDAKKKVTKY